MRCGPAAGSGKPSGKPRLGDPHPWRTLWLRQRHDKGAAAILRLHAARVAAMTARDLPH